MRDLAGLDRNARAALDAGTETPEIAEYVQHHLGELSDDALLQAFGTCEKELLVPSRFLAAMELRRLGVSVSATDLHAVLDYRIPANVADAVLAVYVDGRGRITDIAQES